jgi:DNA-binding response OmpR family regulator
MSSHILFVDDEAPTRELMSLFLTKKGFKVSTAMTVGQGQELAQENRFDLAILDVDVGGENGLKLLELFKREYPRMPVIMFTGLRGDEALLEKAKACGADAFVRKTESLATLHQEVVRLIPAGDGARPG